MLPCMSYLPQHQRRCPLHQLEDECCGRDHHGARLPGTCHDRTWLFEAEMAAQQTMTGLLAAAAPDVPVA